MFVTNTAACAARGQPMTKRVSSSFHPNVEELDSRTLLATAILSTGLIYQPLVPKPAPTIQFRNGDLYIDGTAGPDSVAVSYLSGGRYRVQTDSLILTFPAS